MSDTVTDTRSPESPNGLRCPFCGCPKLRQRKTWDGRARKNRTRFCTACGRRVLTHEVIVGQPRRVEGQQQNMEEKCTK